ncbi:MAG: AI-2E family transporter [Chloroflexota bacterium]
MNTPHNVSHSISQRPWLWAVTAGTMALVAAVVMLALAWLLRRPLALLFLGLTLAAAFSPLVAWLRRRWFSHRVATIVVYVAFVLLLVGVGAILVPMAIEQIERFTERVPAYLQRLDEWLRQRGGVMDGFSYEQVLPQLFAASSQIASWPLQFSSTLVDALLVIFISLYALLLAPQLQEDLLSLLPAARQDKAKRILEDMTHAMGGYIRAASISGAILGLGIYILLVLLGINFALGFALLAGVAEFIPFVGPFVSGAFIVTVVFLESPTKALIALVAMLIFQQVQSNLISPNIIHPYTCISPVVTLFIVVAGGTTGGVLGALIAVPLYAAFRVVLMKIIFPAIRRYTGAEPVEDSEEGC